MNQLEDYELQREYVEPSLQRPQRWVGWWIIAAIVAIGVAAGIYVRFGRRTVQAPPPQPVVVREEPVRPLGGQAEPIVLPPLDESDALVRTLVRALSNHPVAAAWLTSDDLIRKFTVAVSNIAENLSPGKQLSTLRPHANFAVVEKDGKHYIDPRSYDRYGSVADAVGSIDAVDAARLYATLKPRIEDAAGELGIPVGGFDRVLERAIVVLLRTPTPDGPVRVTRNVEGIGYGFADDRLEELSAGQKALLRMGPHNARVVKTKLREIAVALGVPPAHLPTE